MSESDFTSAIQTKERKPFAAIHMLVHPDEKTFQCPTCRKRHRVDEDCTSNPDKMELLADDHDLPRATEHAWQAVMLDNRPPRLFRLDAGHVRLVNDAIQAVRIERLGFAAMRYEVAKAGQWTRATKGAPRSPSTRQPAEPPRAVVENMLATPIDVCPIPILRGIIKAPAFTFDGTLIEKPGYHPTSGLFYAQQEGFEVPAVAARPDAGDISLAKALLLEELLGDFPFVADSDRAAILTSLMLPFVRDMIVGPTPIVAIEKPSPGTGGSLLVDVITALSTGRSVPAMTASRQEEEMRKRLTSALLSMPTFINYDNVTGKFQSDALASAVTATFYEDRRLGQSENIRVPVRCAWLLTGNNPAYHVDLIRRMVRCRLDAKVAHPWLRTQFKHADIKAWAAEHRGELVWSVLTLVRAWLNAGRPMGSRTLGSFAQWAGVMGGIFDVAGITGFLENLAEFYEQADSETGAWVALITRWWDTFRSRDVGVAELFGLMNPGDGDPIDLGLGDGSDRSQKSRLGRRLVEMRDRRFGVHQVCAGRKYQGAQQWKLVSHEAVAGEHREHREHVS